VPILAELQERRRKGLPGVVRRNLYVLQNKKWLIRGAYKVSIVLVNLGSVYNFEQQLPKLTRDELAKGEQGFFPKFPFLEPANYGRGHGTNLVSYTHAQVNLLASQMEYMAEQASALIRGILPRPVPKLKLHAELDVKLHAELAGIKQALQKEGPVKPKYPSLLRSNSSPLQKV